MPPPLTDTVAGNGLTVKLVLVAVPLGVVTTIGPVVAEAGKTAFIVVELGTLKDAAFIPLNVTAVAPVRFVPIIVIDAPLFAQALVGVKLVIVDHEIFTCPAAPEPEIVPVPASPLPPPPPPGAFPFAPGKVFPPPFPPFPVPVPPAPPALVVVDAPLLPEALVRAEPPPPPPPSLFLPSELAPSPPANFIVPIVVVAIVPPVPPVMLLPAEPPAATTKFVLKLELPPAIPAVPPAPTVTVLEEPGVAEIILLE